MSRCKGTTLRGERCKNNVNCRFHITFRMGSDHFPTLNRYFNDRAFMNRWVRAFDQTMETEEDVFITFRRLSGEDTHNFSDEMNRQFLKRFFAFKYEH